jgi:hypothetical protein
MAVAAHRERARQPLFGALAPCWQGSDAAAPNGMF